MRDTKDMQRRIWTTHRLVFAGLILSFSLASCGWDATLDGYGLAPSDYAIQRGYPDLQPASAFRIADYKVPDPSNLIARLAMLKRKIIALRGPVLSSADRARLEAAVKRTSATQG